MLLGAAQNAQSASLTGGTHFDAVRQRKSDTDAQRASIAMSELTPTELLRRQKISEYRKGKRIAGDGARAATAKRVASTDAWVAQLLPVLTEISEAISSFTGIATELNRRGIPARRGGEWSAKQVERVLLRNHR